MEFKTMKPQEKSRGSAFGTSYHVCYSRKMGRQITVFSNLCFDRIIMHEMNHAVESYCERPFSDSCYINGKKVLIEPDIAVEYSNGDTLFEWMRYEASETSSIEDRISSWSHQTGSKVRILRPEDVYSGKYLMRNLHLLAARSRRVSPGSKTDDKLILYYLKENTEITIGKLYEKGLLSRSDGMSYISDLYYRGKITIPKIADESISYRTEVVANA